MKLFLMLTLVLFSSCAPKWYVEWRGDVDKARKMLEGQALLLKSESEKKIAIETAKAKLESAKYEALAEVERAKGVAEANKIIGKSLKGNQSYLRYLWINSLNNGNSETIYQQYL